MSEPLDLESIKVRKFSQWLAIDDRLALLAEVERLRGEVQALRDEIADRTNVEADLRAQLAEAWEKGHTVGSRRHTLTGPS